MKSFTGNFSSVRGWALLLALLLGVGMMISACGDEETPAPTTPTPPPAPPPAPPPEPEPTGPATPDNLRVTGTTSSSITWSWNAVEGALGYQGQFSTDATFTDTDPTFIVVAPATSHTVSNLSGNMTGHFRVRSGAGTSLTDLTYSDWSDGVMGTSAAPPPATRLDAPTGFRVTGREDNAITLEWDEVDEAETYEVEQQVDGDSGWSNARCGGNDNVVDETGCVASGLAVDTDYNFRVRAFPADDDDTLRESTWTETSNAVSTTGTRTPETSSMGEGDLGVTWESTATTITWEWELTDNRDHMYQIYVDDTADIDDDTPCPKPTADSTWDTGSKDRRRHSVDSGVAAGDVRLFCVQTMWEDDNGVPQYGNMSWAWAATTPTTPANGDATDVDGKTTMITWDTVGFNLGFRYVVKLASDTAEEGDITASQGSCKSGTDVATETTDVELDGIDYEVGSSKLSLYTSNRLCYRAENSSGMSEWAIGNPVSTLPGAPGTVRAVDSSLDHSDTAMSWTVAKKDGTPREQTSSTGYNAVVITDVDQANRNSRNTRFCTDAGDDDPAKFSRVAATSVTTTQDGVTVSYTAPTNTDQTNPKVYHLCIQGQLDGSAARAGPWVSGGTVTQSKAP